MSRPRGTGRIYNQKQSSILWIQYYRDGKMHRESTCTADKRKATRILSRRLAKISTGSFTAPDVARMPRSFAMAIKDRPTPEFPAF
jgi:hypothetical protein